MTLKQAMEQGLVDPMKGQFTQAGRDAMTLEQAIAMGWILGWMAREVASEGQTEAIPLSALPILANPVPLSLAAAIEQGLVDEAAGLITNPRSGVKMPLLQAVAQGIIDSKTPSVIDPVTQEAVPLGDALSRGLIDQKELTFYDSKANVSVPLSAAKGMLIDIPERERALSLGELTRRGLVDADTGFITDPNTGEKMTLVEAVSKGVVDASKPDIEDPVTKEKLALFEAIQKGLVDPKKAAVLPIQPMTLGELVNLGLVKDGMVTDPNSGLQLPLSAAVERGLIDDNVPTILHPTTKQPLTVSQALEAGVLNPDTCKVTDPETRKEVSLHEALGIPARKPLTLGELLDRGLVEMRQALLWTL